MINALFSLLVRRMPARARSLSVCRPRAGVRSLTMWGDSPPPPLHTSLPPVAFWSNRQRRCFYGALTTAQLMRRQREGRDEACSPPSKCQILRLISHTAWVSVRPYTNSESIELKDHLSELLFRLAASSFVLGFFVNPKISRQRRGTKQGPKNGAAMIDAQLQKTSQSVV